MRHLVIGLVIILSLLQLGAQDGEDATTEIIGIRQWVESFEGETITRPMSAAIPMQAEVVTYSIDGLLGEEVFISSEAIDLRISTPRNWIKNTTSEEYSLSYNHRIMTELQMTFTLLAADEFLGEPSADSLIAYLAGLKESYGDRLIIPDTLNQELRETGYHRFLLSRPTYYLDYQLLDVRGKNPIRYFGFYLQADNNSILELTLSGPKENVDGMLDDYKALLRDLGIYEEDE